MKSNGRIRRRIQSLTRTQSRLYTVLRFMLRRRGQICYVRMLLRMVFLSLYNVIIVQRLIMFTNLLRHIYKLKSFNSSFVFSGSLIPIVFDRKQENIFTHLPLVIVVTEPVIILRTSHKIFPLLEHTRSDLSGR